MSVVAGQDEEPVPACRGQPDGQRAARDKRTVPSQLAWETGEVPAWVPVLEPGEGVKEGHKVTRGSPESQVFLFSLRESFTSSWHQRPVVLCPVRGPAASQHQWPYCFYGYFRHWFKPLCVCLLDAAKVTYNPGCWRDDVTAAGAMTPM